MEQLSPAELAAKVKSTPPKKTENVRDPGVNQMVEKARNTRVWQFLENGKFEESAVGFVVLRALDTSDYDDPGRVISGIDVKFVDANGYSTQIGGIRGSWMKGPQAFVNTSPYEIEPLFPSDERWDAVVGTIGRALLRYEDTVNEVIVEND